MTAASLTATMLPTIMSMPTISTPALLEVSGLSKAFGGLRAVAGVSFSLAAGQMVALIGPNGAGKSTCFNLLGGQLPADSGSVRLDGCELLGRSPQRIWRLGVGRTFQIPAAFGSMTVLENIQMVLLSRQRRLFHSWWPVASWFREPALAVLAGVGLEELAGRPVAELAYGDLKRVELALALASMPRLLLMDEPTAGMAAGDRPALMALVRRLVRERGLTVLFTEHDMDVVFGHADHVIVLAHGQLIAAGSPAQVQADPRAQAAYLGAVP